VQFGGRPCRSVLDDGNNLRVATHRRTRFRAKASPGHPVSCQGRRISGVVRADSLDYLEEEGPLRRGPSEKQLTYVTKLYNEEMQGHRPGGDPQICGILDGKRRVSVDLPDGSTFVTALAVFRAARGSGSTISPISSSGIADGKAEEGRTRRRDRGRWASPTNPSATSSTTDASTWVTVDYDPPRCRATIWPRDLDSKGLSET